MKTVVLFFRKGEPTKKVWFYQLDKHFTKTHPLTEADLSEFVELQATKAESEHSWSLDTATLDDNYDLSVKNPNKVEEVDERTPQEIAAVLVDLNKKNTDLLKQIMEMIG